MLFLWPPIQFWCGERWMGFHFCQSYVIQCNTRQFTFNSIVHNESVFTAALRRVAVMGVWRSGGQDRTGWIDVNRIMTAGSLVPTASERPVERSVGFLEMLPASSPSILFVFGHSSGHFVNVIMYPLDAWQASRMRPLRPLYQCLELLLIECLVRWLIASIDGQSIALCAALQLKCN